MLKSSLSQNSSSLKLSVISKSQSNSNITQLLIINKEELSIFNIESLLTLENTISYFFNPKIKPEANSFIDYFKTIRYFMFNISLKRLFQIDDNSSKNLEIIEKFLNLQFLTILLEGTLLHSFKDNIRLKNIIINCISSSHQSFLLFCKIIIYELNKKNYTNIFNNRLTQIILKKSIIRAGRISKDIFKNIDKKNEEILQNLKNILNINKSMTKVPKGLSPISTVLKAIDKIKSNWTIDYCLKVLGLSNDEIKEMKEASYLDLEYDPYPLYIPIKIPFLDKITDNSYVLTVVLDLDETLIRYNMNNNEKYDKNNLIKRPYLDDFLTILQKEKCELIIFTASSQEYADPLIDEIEKNKKYFSKRLYRQHTALIGDNYVKDLTKLGRDLSKIIIVDNEKSSFNLQQKNGVLIKPFYGNENDFNIDMALDNLGNILLKIIKSSFQDIRKELELFKEEIETKVTKDI